MELLSIIAIAFSVFTFGLSALLYRRTKANEAEIADVHMQLHDSIARVIAQVKAINEMLTPLEDRLKTLETVNEEYGELYIESAKAERRFTEGVANLLNYDFSVASRPPTGRVEK